MPSAVSTTQSEGNMFTGVNPNVFGSVANQINNVAGVDANSATSFLNFFQSNRDYNNAWSASQARIQREWQEAQNAKAMQFNASEAAKNRDWQQMMSNTAHQREVADLQAAGLNPILSAMNGNGAAVTSGATASGVSSSGAAGQTDTSMNQMLVTLLGSFLDAQTRLQLSNINAINNLAVAEKQGEINQALAYLNYVHNYSLNSQKHGFDISYLEKDYEKRGEFTEKYPSTIPQAAAVTGKIIGELIGKGAINNPGGFWDSLLGLFGASPWSQGGSIASGRRW